jgi:hypothetical protein
MDGRERATVEDALEAAYQNVTAVAAFSTGCSEPRWPAAGMTAPMP